MSLFLYHKNIIMMNAGRVICTLYSKIVHVIYVLYAIHTVAEKIRSNIQDIKKLINCKIILNSPYCTHIFITLAPGTPLPSESVITRWETWLNAANYNCENFFLCKKVLLELNHVDSSTIIEKKNLCLYKV